MTQNPIRYFVVLKNPNGLEHSYFEDSATADRWAARYIALQIYGPELVDDVPFTIASRPSALVHLVSEPDSERPLKPRQPHELVVSLNVTGNARLSPAQVVDDIIKAALEKPEVFVGGSPDIPFASSDHWCVGDAADPMFSDRSAAQRLIRADALRTRPNTTGKGVNVVIVDQGLDKRELGSSYGGGWKVGAAVPGAPQQQPGSIRRPHGMMMAHNILEVAPDALLFDLPLAPPRISNITNFLSLAYAAYSVALTDVWHWKRGKYPGPWIFVNPWGIYDRSSEVPLGGYTTNPHNCFNRLIGQVVADDNDVVFAAGNCGQFCPDMRCGEEDQGPGYSIWGANSLAQVLTVGAIRADSMWLGYSSQGPGQLALGPNKPDLCATSQFREDGDAFSINTGTSAACGLAAGVVAALRSRWDSARVSPHQLKHVLNQSARKPPGLGSNPGLRHRLGHGVLDANAAFDQLMMQFP
ncbi:S8 family serine peptidase [uncultured Bradyrhizobium sp.]|uniref:S8 family serine peptidase n=1 Tax=uncultured Bradyrhizobium sp. TaxID=199684 RepID=UPI0035CAB76F